MGSRLGFRAMLTAHEPGGVRCPRFSVLPRPLTLKGGQQTDRFMESRLGLLAVECLLALKTRHAILGFMTAEALRKAMQDTKPFCVRTSDGKTVDVPHPDFAVLSPSGRIFIVTRPDDSYEVLDVFHISAIECPGQPAQ